MLLLKLVRVSASSTTQSSYNFPAELKDAGSEVENRARSLGQQAHETYDAMKARAEHGRNAAHEKTAEIIQKAREYAGDVNQLLPSSHIAVLIEINQFKKQKDFKNIFQNCEH